MPRNDAATQNVTDLRRARQHARSTVRTIQQAILDFLEGEGFQIWQQQTAGPREKANQLNQAITAIAARQMRQDLVQWLEERHKTSMARAARAAFSSMQQTLPRSIDEDDLFSSPNLDHKDRMLNAELKQIDAGLLYEDGDSIAEEIGDRTTRQIRIGFSQNEPVVSQTQGVSDIADRVKGVITQGDADNRDEKGISGMSAQSKAELIAHDSVQDAYVSSAHRRYLNNGFRYAIYDAVIDRKTSAVCRRLNEVVVDLVEQPWLLPPNHPWCRSGLRPLLELPEERDVIDESDIGDNHLKNIWGTNGFRPKVVDTQQEFNPTALNELLPRAGT